ncbi:hypothetical protein K474DRAFT_1678927 [Panus rudis PR-1116 ss-1]|nr:hypothetical protein K474DRAFT_1678927 [Panus rudis PR-1116 ss-1]
MDPITIQPLEPLRHPIGYQPEHFDSEDDLDRPELEEVIHENLSTISQSMRITDVRVSTVNGNVVKVHQAVVESHNAANRFAQLAIKKMDGIQEDLSVVRGRVQNVEARLSKIQDGISHVDSMCFTVEQINREHTHRLRELGDHVGNLQGEVENLQGRVDDLSTKVDHQFEFLNRKIDTQFEFLNRKMDTQFARVDAQFVELRGQFSQLMAVLVAQNRVPVSQLPAAQSASPIAGPSQSTPSIRTSQSLPTSSRPPVPRIQIDDFTPYDDALQSAPADAAEARERQVVRGLNTIVGVARSLRQSISFRKAKSTSDLRGTR